MRKATTPAGPPRYATVIGYMKLVINAISTKPGGGLTVLSTLLRGLRRLGTNLHVSVLVGNRRTLEVLQQIEGVDTVVPVLTGAPGWKFYWWELYALNGLLRDLKADVVLRSNHYLYNVACPQVVLHQNLWRFEPPNTAVPPVGGFVEGLRNRSARKALRSASANVFVSEYLRRFAECKEPESAPRNHVIHNCVDDALLEYSSAIPDRYDGSPVIAAVQDGNIQKDNATLVRMLSELVRREPKVDWRLKVAGCTGIGRFGEDFIQLARDLGVNDRIEWLGFQDQNQIDELLRTSLCLVFTSVVEAFGLPPLEAMARRCPVVACNSTAIPEVIRDAGILVEPRNSSDFAEGVIRLYQEPELRRQMSERGLARAMHFRASAGAIRFSDVFESVTGMRLIRSGREARRDAAQRLNQAAPGG